MVISFFHLATLQPLEEDQFSILNRAIVDDVHRLISTKLSTKDIHNLVKAFLGSALQSTLKTAVLGEQKSLYLMVDDEAYNGHFQYYYNLNNCTELLPLSVSPQLDDLPLATEEKYSLGYADILQLESIEWSNDGGQPADLSALFHSVHTFKVVRRKVGGLQEGSSNQNLESPPHYLLNLCQLLEQFRPQLRSLTIAPGFVLHLLPHCIDLSVVHSLTTPSRLIDFLRRSAQL